MGNNELVSQTELAQILGVSQAMVSKYIQQGKIKPNCIELVGKYKKIRVQCARKSLDESLYHNKSRKARTLEQDNNFEAMEEYESFISFDPYDLDELGVRLALALDTLSILAANLKPDAQKRLERNLEDIADQFGCRRNQVDGLTGKRCISLEEVAK